MFFGWIKHLLSKCLRRLSHSIMTCAKRKSTKSKTNLFDSVKPFIKMSMERVMKCHVNILQMHCFNSPFVIDAFPVARDRISLQNRRASFCKAWYNELKISSIPLQCDILHIKCFHVFQSLQFVRPDHVLPEFAVS